MNFLATTSTQQHLTNSIHVADWRTESLSINSLFNREWRKAVPPAGLREEAKF